MRTLIAFIALGSVLLASELDDARKLVSEGKHAEARPLLERLVSQDAANVDLLLELARCQRRESADDAAMDTFEKAAKLAPERADVLFEYGSFNMDQAGRKRSVSCAFKGRDLLEKVVSLNPQHVQARQFLIGFYSQAPWIVGGSMKKAYAHTEALQKADPEEGMAMLLNLKIQEKKYEVAFALVEARLKEQPDAYRRLFQLGAVCLESKQRLAEGEKALERCLDMTVPKNCPGLDIVHLLLGRIAQAQGNSTLALQRVEKGLQQNPQSRPLKHMKDELVKSAHS